MKKYLTGLVLASALIVPAFSKAQVSIPFFYAKKSFVAQTAAIPTYTLFTAPADGDYVIHTYTEMGPGTSGATLIISWTDDFGVQTASYGITAGLHTNTVPATIHAISGTPVTVAVTYDPGSGATAYNLFFTILGQ